MADHAEGPPLSAPVLDAGQAAAQAALWRGRGERVVFTNGHFDLLHAGHLRYLQAARALGDHLIVGLNSDASTRARKGPRRPITPEAERGALLAALRCVDGVVIFDGEDCCDLVAAVRPDVYVKGADWQRPGSPYPPEAAVVEALGGAVAFIELVPERSTSELIARIVSRYGDHTP